MILSAGLNKALRMETASSEESKTHSCTSSLSIKEDVEKPIKDESENWQKRSHFLLATIGAAVGIGNVWRFPVLAQKYGGGSFILVYTVLAIIEGIPLTYMELGIGQLIKSDIFHMWYKVHPLARGVGLATCFVSLSVASYYAITLTWCLHYFLSSFRSPLPWIFCPAVSDSVHVEGIEHRYERECLASTPAEYHWYRKTLNISNDISSEFQWNGYIIALLITVWIIMMISLRNGIQSVAKVLYFTVLYPYVGLLILFLRTVVLPSSAEGLLYYLTPQWDSLLNVDMWTDASSQVLFSIGIGVGFIPMFSSLNIKPSNSLIDATIVVVSDTLTSLLGALVVFSIQGFRAGEKLAECLTTATSLISPSNNSNPLANQSHFKNSCNLKNFLNEKGEGTGLAFINFTYTLSYLPGASLFSALFFLMLFCLGFDSLAGYILPPIHAIRKICGLKMKHNKYSTTILCLLLAAVGIVMTQPSGEYILQLMSFHCQDFSLLVLTLIECLVFAAATDLRQELRKINNPKWLAIMTEFLCIVINPIILGGMIYSYIKRHFLENNTYFSWNKQEAILKTLEYPNWTQILGYGFPVVPITFILTGAIYELIRKYRRKRKCILSNNNNNLQRIKTSPILE